MGTGRISGRICVQARDNRYFRTEIEKPRDKYRNDVRKADEAHQALMDVRVGRGLYRSEERRP
jgi:hypothetical protein